VSLLTLDEALDLRKGKKLVFTNGVFDILHSGHVAYLNQARDLGDLMIVGINTDESVRSLEKDDDRPIHTLEERGSVLSALRCVDGVVAFGEKTPERVIEILKPEVHVKGGDYDSETMPETPLVRSYGGKVVILPLVPGKSTTEIARKLRGE
jgi:rfaE bifunctional protein nucleotidyltransferase chain/domain